MVSYVTQQGGWQRAKQRFTNAGEIAQILVVIGVVALVGTLGSLVGAHKMVDPWFPSESFGNVGEWVAAAGTVGAILALRHELVEVRRAEAAVRKIRASKAIDAWHSANNIRPTLADPQRIRDTYLVLINAVEECADVGDEVADALRRVKLDCVTNWRKGWHYCTDSSDAIDHLCRDLRTFCSETADNQDVSDTRARLRRFFSGTAAYPLQQAAIKDLVSQVDKGCLFEYVEHTTRGSIEIEKRRESLRLVRKTKSEPPPDWEAFKNNLFETAESALQRLTPVGQGILKPWIQSNKDVSRTELIKSLDEVTEELYIADPCPAE